MYAYQSKYINILYNSIYQEHGRQKLRAQKLGAIYVKKVDEDMMEISEGTSQIYAWIRNQALFKNGAIIVRLPL